ncbi:MAG: glycerate-2-kinase family protein, partial [Candidatus Woesearchaeota archaeon]
MIKNYKQLAASKKRKVVLDIINKVFEENKTEKIIKNTIRMKNSFLIIKNNKINLRKYKNTYLIGFGKSSARMAAEIEKILPVREGYVNCIEKVKTKRTKITIAGHPYPNENTLLGTEKIISLLKKAKKDDLVVCCISGGGSALLEKPVKGISLQQLIERNKQLIRSGKSIYEINKERIEMSQVKGGKLAKMTKAAIVSLIFSDVVENDIKTIASGPTAIKRKNVRNIILASSQNIINIVKKDCDKRKLKFN